MSSPARGNINSRGFNNRSTCDDDDDSSLLRRDSILCSSSSSSSIVLPDTPIASGGFSDVFLIQREQLDTSRNQGKVEEQPGDTMIVVKRRHRNEAFGKRLIANHRLVQGYAHVVPFLGCSDDRTLLFFRYAPCGSLAQLLQIHRSRGEHHRLSMNSHQFPLPLTLDYVKEILLQLLNTLLFFQGLKVVHCDLKPSNILLKECSSSSSVHIWITDFDSLCRSGEVRSANSTQLHAACTSAYAAVEQLVDEPATISPKTDIVAFGVIAAELLSTAVDRTKFIYDPRRHSVVQFNKRRRDLIARALKDDSSSLLRQSGGGDNLTTTTVLEDVILSCLSAEPKERPSAQEIIWTIRPELRPAPQLDTIERGPSPLPSKRGGPVTRLRQALSLRLCRAREYICRLLWQLIEEVKRWLIFLLYSVCYWGTFYAAVWYLTDD